MQLKNFHSSFTTCRYKNILARSHLQVVTKLCLILNKSKMDCHVCNHALVTQELAQAPNESDIDVHVSRHNQVICKSCLNYV